MEFPPLEPQRSITPPRSPCSDYVFSTPNAATSTPPRRFTYNSPMSSRSSLYSDRFIPSRLSSNLEDALLDCHENLDTKPNNNSQTDITHENQILNSLIRSELLGKPAMMPHNESDSNGLSSSPHSNRSSTNVLKFSSRRRTTGSTPNRDSYQAGFTPIATQALTNSPKKATRKIAKVPYKVLDAPNLADDYYLNLVDWSSTNVLAVALGGSIFLWSASTSKVSKLCELEGTDTITSITWAVRGENPT